MNLEKKIHACWLGKAIGGTLGTPFEGVPDMMDLDFYDPVPDKALPNDDLDLQIVWAYHLLENGHSEVTPEILLEAWKRHVAFPFDEYGIALRNAAWGVPAWDCGWRDNWFGNGMGAAIRSEIWACVAPGNPARAAGFAWADAVVDHSGDGVWAEVFFAALESAAFEETDKNKLLDLALGFLPDDSLLVHAVQDTRQWWTSKKDWRAIRTLIVEKYGTDNFTDVVANVAFTVLGWLAGENQLGKSICIAVNCGLDTDCTGATLGALMGIIDPDCIEEKWLAPIGEDIVISSRVLRMNAPKTLSDLTRMTRQLAKQLENAKPEIGPIRKTTPLSLNESIRPLPVRIQPMGGNAPETVAQFPGHWIRLPLEQFGPEGLKLTFQFVLPVARFVEAMLYVRGCPARMLLDGQEVLTLEPDDLEGVAPSFHRGEKSVVALGTLTASPYTVEILFDRPSDQDYLDLVFGLADPATHLWFADVDYQS